MGLDMKKVFVICVDNIASRRFVVLQDFTPIGIPMEVCELYALTIGNKYEALGEMGKILVTNDNGVKKFYPRDKFKPYLRSDVRDDKINRIINKK